MTSVAIYEVIEQFDCGHQFTKRTDSRQIYEAASRDSNHNQFLLDKPKGNLIGRIRRASTSIHDSKKPRYRQLSGLCHNCKWKEDYKKKIIRLDSDGPTSEEVYEERCAIWRQAKTAAAQQIMLDSKPNFVCARCKGQSELVSKARRNGYEGLCCANGIKEWKDLEMTAKTARPSTASREMPAAELRDSPPPRYSTISTPRRSQSHSRRDEPMNEDGRHHGTTQISERARNRLGEPRDAARQDGDRRVLTSSQQPTYYSTPPGLDVEEWDNLPRSAHSRYPLDVLPPYTPRALPSTPPRRSSLTTPSQTWEPTTPQAPGRLHTRDLLHSENPFTDTPSTRSESELYRQPEHPRRAETGEGRGTGLSSNNPWRAYNKPPGDSLHEQPGDRIPGPRDNNRLRRSVILTSTSIASRYQSDLEATPAPLQSRATRRRNKELSLSQASPERPVDRARDSFYDRARGNLVLRQGEHPPKDGPFYEEYAAWRARMFDSKGRRRPDEHP